MERKRKLFVAKAGVVLAVIPVLIWAHEYGPDVGYCGVPKENGTCAQSGCHTGTANDPANAGSVSVAFPGGTSYVPGVKQHLVVTIADPAPTQKAWGFQLTARDAGNPASIAGSFASTDQNTLVMCGDTFVNPNTEMQLNAGASQNCPSGKPLAYIEHSLAGYNATRGHTGSQTFEFDWTPPATGAGDIVVYVAGNAANGDLTSNGDHIYTATYTLTAAAAGSAPTIASVVNGGSYQPGIETGSWVTIKGSNLANIADPGRTWRPDEIVNGNLPASLDGVGVTIDGKPAAVYFISKGQINVQAPDDSAQGPVDVVVTNNGAASAPATAQLQPYAPGFFQWGATNYAIATRYPDNALIGNPSAVPGTVAAKPGDVLILWATGFGPSSPPTVAAQVVTSPNPVASAPAVTVGGTSVTVIGAAMSPGSAGLYQIAIQLPKSIGTGDQPVVATVGGFQSAAGVNLFIASQ